MSLGTNLNWIKTKELKLSLNKIVILILSILISFYIVRNLNTKILFLSVLISSSLYLFLISIIDLKNQKLKLSQRISHLAFSIIVFSIILNSVFSNELSVNLKVGEEKMISDHIVNFEKISKRKIDNYTSIRAKIVIKQNKNKLDFYPELRLYETPKMITSEADIKTNLFNDNLLVVNYLKDTEYLNIRYQKKPFMLLIWLSAIMLGLGGILGLRDKLK